MATPSYYDRKMRMDSLFHKYLERAREELSLGRLESAAESLDSAAFMEPDHIDVACCRIELLRAQGHYEEAATHLKAALKLHPYQPWWVLDLADILINRLQEPGLALDWLGRLERCSSLDSSQRRRAFRLKVEAMIDQERLYEASLVLHRALSFYPRDAHLLFLRGWVSLHRSNFYGAASAFHRILRQDPQHADAHYYLGLAFAAIGELRLMRCHFEQAHLLDRDDPSPLRFEPQEFEQMAQHAVDVEMFKELPQFHLVVRPYPSSSLLDEIGLDPRRPGALLQPYQHVPCIGPRSELVLLLFQRNIERFCTTEPEVREEIQDIVQREFMGVMQLSHEIEAETPPAALGSG